MSTINLSDDLLNNFEDSIKSFITFLLQDPTTGSSTAAASGSTSEQNASSFEQHMRRIYDSANEIECNLLQLKTLVNRTLPEEQILENITDLRTNIERKENLLREFNQYLNDAIADFSVENTESLNGLLDELSRGTTSNDLMDNLSQTSTTATTTTAQNSLLGTLTMPNPTTFDMDRRILCDSLIKWIKTLNLNRTIHGIGDFSDGILIGICLKNIDPNHFNENCFEKLRIDTGDNYRIKENNLKKILKSIVDYYSEILGQSLSDFQMPDLNLIAEHFDEIELSRLLQLVLGCAVSCDQKQYYIEQIMSLEPSVQHVLMNAIQELMIKENRKNADEYSDIAVQLKNALEELNRIVEAKDEIENRCRELDLQILVLQDEKCHLIQETKNLNQRLQNVQNTDNTISQNRYQNLQQRIDVQQEEIFRLEAALQDSRLKFEVLRDENENLLKQNDNLMVLAGDARSFKDELDILRHKCEKMTKLESTIDIYKIKLEEMSELRQQIKYLEETNQHLFDEKSNLEQECKQTKLLQTQIEFHKKTNQELYQKFNELQRIADKTEFERHRLEERLNTINAEKFNLNHEIQLLKETNEQLKTVDVDQANHSPVQMTGSLDDLNVPIDIRERFIHLQHENRLLKLHEINENNNEQLLILQVNCEQLKDQNNQLTNDLWMANKRILELEATIEDMNSLNEITDLKKSLNRTTTKHEEESTRMKNHIDELQKRLDHTEKQLAEKIDMISKKTIEINAMEERYVQYLEKAKMILRQMDPRNNNSISHQEIQLLKKQLVEKDRKLKDVEKEYEIMKAIKEDQEKLLVSAWYSLGSTLQRRQFEECLKSHQNQSFLSKQRHIPSSSQKQNPPDPSTK